ncbi:MAG TPA: P-loop NTPase, partial [Terriglobia bacterium]|nr:P-loop NTPase [Terriglobia bacterium]
IFGHGGARRASAQLGYPFLGEIPLNPAIRTSSDSGKPAVLMGEKTPYAKAFLDIASAAAAQVSIANFNAPQAPVIEG